VLLTRCSPFAGKHDEFKYISMTALHAYVCVCEHTNICRLKPEAVVLVVHQAIRSEHFMVALQEERGSRLDTMYYIGHRKKKSSFFMKDKKGFQGYGQNDC
jgi:hypothetical protein